MVGNDPSLIGDFLFIYGTPMSRRSVFMNSMIRTCWIPLLLAAIAVSVQAFQILSEPAVYSAVGRIFVGPELVQTVMERESATITSSAQADLLVDQIEILKSSKLKARTLERIRALHPELKEVEIELIIKQLDGGPVVLVGAVGGESKYTRSYLDALLDEYFSIYSETVTPATATDCKVAIMTRPDPAMEIVHDLWAPLIVWSILGAMVGLLVIFTLAIVATQRDLAKRAIPPPLP